MDNLVQQTINLIKKTHSNVITISETSHWSYTSHTFQFKLLKELHKTNITCFSSERIGLLDAFLMNKWLDGEIKCSLDELYKIIPFGGIGTYRWMEYFQNTRKPFNLIGCEMDNLSQLQDEQKSKLILILHQLCSDNFEIFLNKKITSKAVTENDKIVKHAINAFYDNGWDKRYPFWFNNIKKTIDKYGNLYINGFHFEKDNQYGDCVGTILKKKYNALILGMDSVKKYHPVIDITPKWLKDNKADKDEFLSPKFWDKFGEYANSNYSSWINKVEELSKYIEVNANIQNYNGFFLIKASTLKYPIIQQVGANPMPIKNGEKIVIEYETRNPDKLYDYMVYIPISRFNKDLRK